MFNRLLSSKSESFLTTNPLSEMSQLPHNVHVSSHPCLLGKLSQLRAATANARETKALVHEISTIVGCEALAAGLTTKSGPTVRIHI